MFSVNSLNSVNTSLCEVRLKDLLSSTGFFSRSNASDVNIANFCQFTKNLIARQLGPQLRPQMLMA